MGQLHYKTERSNSVHLNDVDAACYPVFYYYFSTSAALLPL